MIQSCATTLTPLNCFSKLWVVPLPKALPKLFKKNIEKAPRTTPLNGTPLQTLTYLLRAGTQQQKMQEAT